MYFKKVIIAIALISASEVALAENSACFAASGECHSPYENCDSDIDINGDSLTFCSLDPSNGCSIDGITSTSEGMTTNTPACPEDGGGDGHEDHDHGGVTDDNSGAPVGMQGMMAVTMIFSVILGSLALA